MTAPIQILQKLCKTTFRLLKPEEPFTFNLNEIKSQMNKITAKDIGFDSEAYREKELTKKGGAPVTYIQMFQDKKSHSMGIFVVKTDEVLPLHDHPGMLGLLKVVYGKVKVTSYSETESQPIPQDIPLDTEGENIKTVIKNPDIIASTDSECCCLTPNSGNFHEIEPLTDFAAFIDILAPPYNYKGCHYYEVLDDPSPQADEKHHWLLEIPEPDSYYCDLLPYTGPELV